MAFPYANYGYGAGYGYGVEDFSVGAYNPRYHYLAAQNAGFDLKTEDGLPKTIYVGNLDQSVTEEFIATLFGQIGPVTKTKVIFDSSSEPYAFIEFVSHEIAAQALQAMNRRLLLDKEMKVNWAIQPGTHQQKIDTSKHFHVFVGDLSPEIDNKGLREAFAPFGEISDAKVIRDLTTLMSKGYGFVSYPKRDDAERAIEQMNGQWLGRRTIRTNWATRKPGQGPIEYSKPTVDEIMLQTPPENSSVYVGGVPPGASEIDIRECFKKFGNIVDIRHFKPQGYAFVKFDQKVSAARAISEMNGGEFMGQTLRLNWGKVEGAIKTDPTAAMYASVTGANPVAGVFGTGNVASQGYNPQAQQQYLQQYYQQQANPQQWTGPAAGGAGAYFGQGNSQK